MKRFIVLSTTWFGTGFSPVASGTVGTLGAIPFYLALARLSDDEQAAIQLCFNQGLTHEEAADALGCPLGTVKTHLLRAKEKLRSQLQAWAPA